VTPGAERRDPVGVRHLLLDRDGVLNREAPGGGWIERPEDWEWAPGALDGLRLAAGAGMRVSVVTNQSGIARGAVAAKAVEAVHRRMIAEARAAGGRIDAVFVCPHAPEDGCACRKPAPGLLREAMDAAGSGPAETLLVGDSARDLAAARAAGVRAVLVRTGKGGLTERSLSAGETPGLETPGFETPGFETPIFDTLREAVAALAAGTGEQPSVAAIEAQLAEHRRVFDAAARTLPAVLRDVIAAAWDCLRGGRTVLVCGNGGSAADAQHLAAELVCRVRRQRRALAAVALTTDTSALTAIANDYGYEQVFARQVAALAHPGDLLVAISTSGRSPNVLAAARTARDRGCTIVALTGRDGGDLAPLADHVVAVPADVVSRIQEVHAVCIHVLAEALEGLAASSEGRP
jgi:phosphoheptose isomerase